MEIAELLIWPILLCLLLIVTHTYFGLHVLARGVIFVDLALAQVAALGTSVALLLGMEAHGSEAMVMAFIATILTAVGFAKLREIENKTFREVTIGVVYIVATALSVVILSRSNAGMEELKGMLNGHMLWVDSSEILLLSVSYAAVMGFQLLFRQRFQQLSNEGRTSGSSFLWEFLFFASFAIVITLAVGVAGVLLVFAYLIIPAFSASLLANSFISRLAWGMGLSLLGTLFGLWLSVSADLPVGATIVCVMGLLPLIALLVRRIKSPG